MIEEIQARFLEGLNEDGSGKYPASIYRADVGYLLSLLSKEAMKPDDIAEGWELACEACRARINPDAHVCALCRDGEADKMKATVQDVFDGNAVKINGR